MIADFTDRRPALSTLIIAGLLIVPPLIFVFLAKLLTGPDGNVGIFLFYYAVVLQLVLCLNVRRFILIVFPFILTLTGLVLSEVVYVLSSGSNVPGTAPGAGVTLISPVMVIIFGAEAAGVVANIIVYPAVLLIRKLWDKLAHR